MALKKDYVISGDIHKDKVRTIALNKTDKVPVHFCTHAETRGNKENHAVTTTEKLCEITQSNTAENLASPLNAAVFVEGKDTRQQESEQLEFKKYDDGKNLVKTILDEIRRYVSAFANTFGGHLYIGIDDNGVVQGQESQCIGDRFTFFNRIEGKMKEMIWAQNGRKLNKADVHRGKHWDIEFIPVELKKDDSKARVKQEPATSGASADQDDVTSEPPSQALKSDLAMADNETSGAGVHGNDVASEPSRHALKSDLAMVDITASTFQIPKTVSSGQIEQMTSKPAAAGVVDISEQTTKDLGGIASGNEMKSAEKELPKKKGKGKKAKGDNKTVHPTSETQHKDKKEKVVILITIHRLAGGIVFTSPPQCPIYVNEKVRDQTETEWTEMWMPILFPQAAANF